jgi:hypothetical protein
VFVLDGWQLSGSSVMRHECMKHFGMHLNGIHSVVNHRPDSSFRPGIIPFSGSGLCHFSDVTPNHDRYMG